MEREPKGIWIPIEIWEDDNLSWHEKILFAEIDSFTSKNKDCYISNEYIAKLLKITETTANKVLSSLIKKGYVIKTKFDGRRRFIKTALTYTINQGCSAEQGWVAQQNNILYNNTNIIDNKEDKDKSLSKKNDKDELFEQCWKAYRRKGSKKNAKERWGKLSDEDKQKIAEHIPAYVSSVSEIKYQRDFERYIKDKLYNNVVYRGNSVLFDPEQLNEIGEYRPKTDGFNLHWIESEKCYMTPFDFDMLNDGYTKDNRPSSAVVMHNGLKYQWDTMIKAWIKL